MAATTVAAQLEPRRRYGPGPGGYHDPGDDDDDDDGFDPYGSRRDGPYRWFINSRQRILIAHGVLAALAFVIFFPVGAIIVRLGSFRGVWLVHGLFQIFAYIVYTVAFGIGIWMINNLPADLQDSYHPIIGIIVFVLLFFQPILGFVHHLRFKKYRRRTLWSYGHLWLGRIAITLGIINGGLGLLLASDAPAVTGFSPSRGQIIAYSVVAGVMWLLWVAAAVIGERRRRTAQQVKEVDDAPPPNKEHYAHRLSDSS